MAKPKIKETEDFFLYKSFAMESLSLECEKLVLKGLENHLIINVYYKARIRGDLNFFLIENNLKFPKITLTAEKIFFRKFMVKFNYN